MPENTGQKNIVQNCSSMPIFSSLKFELNLKNYFFLIILVFIKNPSIKVENSIHAMDLYNSDLAVVLGSVKQDYYFFLKLNQLSQLQQTLLFKKWFEKESDFFRSSQNSKQTFS